MGETNRSLWERNANHQQDALNPTKRSHIREHVTQAHPHMLHNMLDVFRISVISSAKSALSRQVREAVEIMRDRSHLLLNNKEEYNRCLVSNIKVEGPAHPKKQAELDKIRLESTESLTKQQEEEALAQAKASHIKKREMGKTIIEEERKRIRLDREMLRVGGGPESSRDRGGDGAEGGDGVYGGGAGVIMQNIAYLQTDIRTFLSTNKDEDRLKYDDNEEYNDGGSKFNEDKVTQTSSIVSDRNLSSESVHVRSHGKIHKHSDKSTFEAVSSQSKLTNTIRPPTSYKVKKFARQRNKTKIGGESRDIRSFFAPKLGPDENRVNLDVSKSSGG